MDTLVEIKIEDVKTPEEVSPYSDEAAVLYQPGADSTYTVAIRDPETGEVICGYSKKPVAEVMKERPELKLVTFGTAWRAVEAVQVARYCNDWVEITKDRFWEMLEVLPPKRWRTHKGVEMFAISEFTTGALTGFFARLGDRYFEATRDYFTSTDEQIAKEVSEAAKTIKAGGELLA